jgi:hypothetical protein
MEIFIIYFLIFLLLSIIYSYTICIILDLTEKHVFDYKIEKFKKNFPDKKKRFLLLLIGGIIPLSLYMLLSLNNTNLNYFKNN